MRSGSLFLCLLTFACLSAAAHPLHLTFTNLEFNNRSRSWTLTIKVFSDDFANNLKTSLGEGVPSASITDQEPTEKILTGWIDTRFRIWFDGQRIGTDKWTLTAMKTVEDATWLIFNFKANPPVGEVRIKNILLQDLFSDQKNLFVLVMGKKQTAFEFNRKDQETVIRLNK